MKALIYRKKNTIENFAITLSEVPDPVPGDSDILVSVKAIGINPGEAQFRRTIDPPEGGYMILGYEFSGIVSGFGKSVKGFAIGDRVFGLGDPRRYGCYAQLIAVDYRNVAKFPSTLPFSDAAALPLLTFTAWQSIFRIANQLPEDVRSVMVIGAAGGVGSMALQLLKAKTNVKILATASRQESAEWSKKMGADDVLDHKKDILQQLKNRGFDTVDMIFSVNGLKESISWIPEVIRPYGYLSLVDLKDAVDLSKLMGKSVTVFMETVFTRVVYEYQYELIDHVLNELLSLMEKGKISSPMNTVLKGLTEANIKTAHNLLEEGSSVGKIVLELD